jgi:hypothetical protein
MCAFFFSVLFSLLTQSDFSDFSDVKPLENRLAVMEQIYGLLSNLAEKYLADIGDISLIWVECKVWLLIVLCGNI